MNYLFGYRDWTWEWTTAHSLCITYSYPATPPTPGVFVSLGIPLLSRDYCISLLPLKRISVNKGIMFKTGKNYPHLLFIGLTGGYMGSTCCLGFMATLAVPPRRGQSN